MSNSGTGFPHYPILYRALADLIPTFLTETNPVFQKKTKKGRHLS